MSLAQPLPFQECLHLQFVDGRFVLLLLTGQLFFQKLQVRHQPPLMHLKLLQIS